MQTCQHKNINAPVKYHSASVPRVWSGPQQGSGLSDKDLAAFLVSIIRGLMILFLHELQSRGESARGGRYVDPPMFTQPLDYYYFLFFFVFSFHPLTSVTKWEKLLALEIFLSCVYMEKIISFFSVDKCYIGFFSVHIEGFYKILSLVLSFILLFRYHFLKIPVFLTCTLLN